MAFGPIMRFTVGELQIELAPMTSETVVDFVDWKHGGGLQRYRVSRFLGMDSAPTIEQERSWYEKTFAAKDCLVWGIWIVEGEGDARTRTLIGNSALTEIGEGHAQMIRQATSGSVIFRPEYWGKGIASAAHKARTWYAFKYMGLHRIKSAVIQANGGSRKALERSGYTFVYTERNEQFTAGEFQHLDNLECLNPQKLFWDQWWHGDKPSPECVAARRKTLSVLKWADENVELA